MTGENVISVMLSRKWANQTTDSPRLRDSVTLVEKEAYSI